MASSDKIEYHKQPLTLDQQVQKLKERGLVFDDESKAKAYLFNISYYRLRAYTYPFQDNSEGSGHRFLQSNLLVKDFAADGKNIYHVSVDSGIYIVLVVDADGNRRAAKVQVK